MGAPQTPAFIPIGKIVGVFGVDGRLKVEPLTDFGERFRPGSTVYIAQKPHLIRWSGRHKEQVRLRLEGIARPSQVQDLIGLYLEVPSESRPALEADEYYARDILGFVVSTEEGRELGHLEEILKLPAHDVFRVGDVLIPAVRHFILDINFENRVIVVRLIPGMLPEEE